MAELASGSYQMSIRVTPQSSKSNRSRAYLGGSRAESDPDLRRSSRAQHPPAAASEVLAADPDDLAAVPGYPALLEFPEWHAARAAGKPSKHSDSDASSKGGRDRRGEREGAYSCYSDNSRIK